jgi:hypothetical protein
MHNQENDDWFLAAVSSGHISVSEDGKVFNHKTNRYIGAVGSGRYPKISLSVGRKEIRHMQIHRLVWLVYRGKISQEVEINHKDTNTNNPSLLNLELITPSGNRLHAIANGRPGYLFQKGNKSSRKTKVIDK